jgi:hypothetical protein
MVVPPASFQPGCRVAFDPSRRGGDFVSPTAVLAFAPTAALGNVYDTVTTLGKDGPLRMPLRRRQARAVNG